CAPQMRELALGALARRTPANGSRRSIREVSFPGQAAASAVMLRIFFIKMLWRRSFQIAAVPTALNNRKLFWHCVVRLLVRVHPALMRLLNIVEPLLLIRCGQRPNLRHWAVYPRLDFLHRLPSNGADFRLGLLEIRVD